MKRMLLLLAVLLPLDAAAEDCVFTSSGSWTSATAYSGEVSGCTLSADDSVAIAAGVTATCPSGAEPGVVDVGMTAGAISVAAGATLRIEAGCALGVPAGGLRVDGTLVLNGQVLSVGGSAPAFSAAALASAPADDPANTALRVEKIVHCPRRTPDGVVSDCSAAPERQQIALCWPGAAAGDWLKRIAVSDVAVFWDPTAGLDPSRDVNAMYEVRSVPGPGEADGCIFLDVLQGAGDEACDTFDDVVPEFDERSRNCTQAQREVQVCSLAATLRSGERDLACGQDADSLRIASFPNEHVGRWLTCTDADANGDGAGDGVWVTSRITATTDGGEGADTLRILPGGFPADVPAGSRCFLDFGWMAGDVLSVFRPAALADGDENIGNGSLLCGGGTCTARFALLNNRGIIDAAGTTDFDDSWIKEPSNQVPTAFIVVLEGSDQTFTRLQVTSTRKNDSHGFAIAGSGSNPRFEDGVLRYGSDDWFVSNPCSRSVTSCTGPEDNSSGTRYAVTLERERIEFQGGGCNGGSAQPGCVDQPCRSTCGGSGGIWDANNPGSTRPATLAAKDVLCVSCNTPDGAGTYFPNTPGSAAYFDGYVMLGVNGQVQDWDGRNDIAANVLRNFVSIDQTNPFQNADNLHAVTELSDASIIGYRCLFPNCGLFRWTGLRSDWSRVLVRDASLVSPFHLLYLGVLSDVSGNWSDIALVNNNNGGGSTPFNVGAIAGSTGSISIDGLTVANLPGRQTTFGTPWQWGGDDAAFDLRRAIRRILFANYFSSTEAIKVNSNLNPADADGVGTLCVHDVQGALTVEPGGPQFLEDPGMQFVGATKGIYVPTTGSLPEVFEQRCGARDVGARDSWPLRTLHYFPTLQREGLTWKSAAAPGADLDGDGIPNAQDTCPYYASADQTDRDANGRGDVCECGDQNGDGRVDTRDFIALNAALFNPALVSPLCDTNGDGACDAKDVIGLNLEIWSPGATSTCSRQPVPGTPLLLSLSSPDDLQRIRQGRPATLEVGIRGVRSQRLDALLASVRFDSSLVAASSFAPGAAIPDAGDFRVSAIPGAVDGAYSRGPGASGVTQDGVLFRFQLAAKSAGSGQLALDTSSLAAQLAGSSATPPVFAGPPLAYTVLPPCVLGQPPDSDCDEIDDAQDNCPYYASADLTDSDANGRGNVCECGDQDGSGRIDARDIVAINLALFDPALVTPLCDADGDGLCTASDGVAVARQIFSPVPTLVCARQPVLPQ